MVSPGAHGRILQTQIAALGALPDGDRWSLQLNFTLLGKTHEERCKNLALIYERLLLHVEAAGIFDHRCR
jgi:hypothetical protein